MNTKIAIQASFKTFFSLICVFSISALADPKPPARQSYHELHKINLTDDIRTLPTPDNQEARINQFKQRNEPEQIEKLAHDLFSLWDFSERRTVLEKGGNRLKHLKDNTVKRYKAKDYAGALDAFRTYYMTKMRLFFKDDEGYISRAFEKRLRTQTNDEAKVQLLMKHAYQVKQTKETVYIGEPGLVRWDFIWEGPKLWEPPQAMPFETFGGSFDRLWWKFFDSGEIEYLNKYLAFLDDYTMNQTFQENMNIGNIDQGQKGAYSSFAYLHSLHELSKVLPHTGEGYSSASLARMMVRLLSVDLPMGLYYNREQSNNHSCAWIVSQFALVNYLIDFKFSKILERESRRQLESYAVLFDLPDGDMPGRMNYNHVELKWNLFSFRQMHDYRFKWLTPSLRREYTDRFTLRARTVLNLYNNNGEKSPLYKADRRNGPYEGHVHDLTMTLPETWNDLSTAKMAHQIIRNQLKPDWKGTVYTSPDSPLVREGYGITSKGEPPYTSVSYPYVGTYILRAGWDPQRDAYGLFVEGDGGGSVHGTKCANSLFIGAFGHDVTNTGHPYQYNYVESPVLVDGCDQFADLDAGPSSRKGGPNLGLSTLRQVRSFHGKNFDVVEGVYDGHWVNSMDHDVGFYDFKYRTKLLQEAFEGVSHRRVVQFIKEPGIWIIYDIMDSDNELRTYTQQFFLSEKNDQYKDGYLKNEFIVDQKNLSLQSISPERSNINIYYAGPASKKLKIQSIKSKSKPIDDYQLYRADRHDGPSFLHLRSDWEDKGKSLLITVMQATDPYGLGNPIKEIQRSVDGFSATLSSGATLSITANLVNKSLENPFGLESHLRYKEDTGVDRGIVLGNDSYVYKEIENDSKIKTDIYRHLPDLVIDPQSNVFFETLDVTIKSPKESVEIRYTLDGSDPTLESPLYGGSIHLNESATVKARAFRLGLKQMPMVQPSASLMTRVFTAVFTRENRIIANEIPQGALKPGLRFTEYRDKWPKMLFKAPDKKAAVNNGVVEGAFDISSANDCQGAFSFLYEGYLVVPEDGTYTIHAPKEFTHFSPLAGYDMNVEIGSKLSYRNGETKITNKLNQWYPSTRRHAFGNWSLNLEKGAHPIRIYYADFRRGAYLEYYRFSYAELNVPGQTKTFFDEKVPHLLISGAGYHKEPIPKDWLKHK